MLIGRKPPGGRTDTSGDALCNLQVSKQGELHAPSQCQFKVVARLTCILLDTLDSDDLLGAPVAHQLHIFSVLSSAHIANTLIGMLAELRRLHGCQYPALLLRLLWIFCWPQQVSHI